MNDVEAKSQSLLKEALGSGASDIHLIPRRNDALVRLRIDQELTDTDTLSNRFSEKLISHFKFLAGMDIGEKRRPQNGALDMKIRHQSINLRLSTLPTPFGESLVLRILPQEQSYSLSELSLFPQTTRQLLTLMNPLNGFILITGPTGSGKTTLLYTLLNEAVERFNRQVITFEDPIEKKSDQFVQMQVNEKADITYAQGFKSILRHDPDVIMIGEIRDAETAHLAVRAAMTGHLVLSTLHTSDSVGCVYRLLEFGIPLSYLEQTLTSVIAQRLVSLVCPYCGEVCRPECRMRRKTRRLGLFEILSGHPLENFLSSLRETPEQPIQPKIQTIEDLLKRGVASGYLSERNFAHRVGQAGSYGTLEKQR
ncbi:MAG TPA: competence type IV pilus ATPase ComGA [Bacillales bacterium]|nr:competence type IV pilus ATPase ComGA [Bacillales bacterium]